jgi:hypothetical protein
MDSMTAFASDEVVSKLNLAYKVEGSYNASVQVYPGALAAHGMSGLSHTE